MFAFQNLSLRRKLTLITLLTSSIALLLAVTVLVMNDRALYREMLVNNLVIRAQVLANSSTAALSFNDPRPVDEALGALRADTRLISATVYTPEGRVFSQYVRADRLLGFRPPPPGGAGHRFENGELLIYEPIKLGDQRLGTLCLQRDLLDLDALLLRYAGIVVLGLLVALSVSLIFSARLQRTITEPIQELASLADQVSAEKNYALRAVKRGRDELGDLTDHFNEMLAKIQARDADLKKAHDQLETRVAERTQELTTALERLRQEIAIRLRAEAGLMEAQRNFLLHTAQTPMGMIDWSVQFEVASWNPAAERIFGYGATEVMGQRGELLVPENAREPVRRIIEDLLARRGGTHSINQNLTKDGRIITCEWFNTPLTDAQGQVIGISSLVQDITQRVQAEIALRQSEHRFTRAFHASPVAISITTLREGRFWDANNSLLKLLDFRREELIGHTATELKLWVHPEDRLRLVEQVLTNHRVRDLQCQFRASTGAVREVLVSVELIEWEGEPSLLFLTHDLTERLNLEMQLRHSQKMDAIGQLAAGVAHDFNNLLTIIRGYTGMLLAEASLPEEMRHPLAEVEFAAERAGSLTRQLLAFSRKQAMQLRAQDFNHVVTNTARMLQRLIGEKTTLQLECAHHLPLVNADASMLEQVLINLAVNARDAMPQGGRLTITTTLVQRIGEAPASGTGARPGHFVCLGVADTGCGMTAATLAHVFEPFFTTKEVGKGSGLGLATVYGIIEQHAGWIEVASEPGQGTRFQIYLPVAEKPVPGHAETPGLARSAGGAECILVVEDEPALREVVRTILTRQGYQVLTAIHGVDALRVWREQRVSIQLLLTDMVMPEGLSGTELAEHLRRDKPDLKVIYTSGYSVELFAGQIELHEGNNFLAKPYRSGALVAAVRNCLDGH